jgi:hypothetical protein
VSVGGGGVDGSDRVPDDLLVVELHDVEKVNVSQLADCLRQRLLRLIHGVATHGAGTVDEEHDVLGVASDQILRHRRATA